MPSLARILLAVDFSGRSRGAAGYAETLSRTFQSEITLLHVLPPPHELGVLENGAAAMDEVRRARTRKAREDLESHLADEMAGLPVRRVLLEGDPSRTIIEYARREAFGLIVIATHGYGPFRRLILGSVTAKVLHDADCPVLTGVHLEHAPNPASLSFRRILAAVDLGPASTRTLGWASWLATALGAELSVIHATPCVAPHSGESSEWGRRLEDEARERITPLAASAGGHPEILIENGDAPGVVCAAAGRLAADLLVIGRGSAAGMFGRLRTNAYAIIRQSPCPVVSV